MQSLFDNNSEDAGFRLHYLEVYNWGTFDRKVWRIQPNGSNSLLTGGNGSGKTTLVDALLTLLVPAEKRFYNQSSGTDRKKERNEESYILGHYGKRQDEEGGGSTTDMLRTKDDYSIILAYFENNGTKHRITLFQIRYWEEGGLKKLYGIAPTQLDIQTHIQPFHKAQDFKKRLESFVDKIEFPASFKEYANRFSSLFGMRSLKALSLFSQTVGIKVLGNMNEFIRNNMLDEQDVEDDFRKLRENFDNLLQSYNEIEKSKAQQLILEQLNENNIALVELKASELKIKTIRDGFPLWYLDERSRLLIEENIQHKVKIETLQNSISVILGKKKILKEDITKLNIALSGSSSYNRLNDLQNQIAQLEKDKNWARTRWDDYNRIAAEVGLKEQPDAKDFEKNKSDAQKKIIQYDEDFNTILLSKARKEIGLQDAKDRFDFTGEELQSFLERKNNIPTDYIALRNRIASEFNLSQSQLPFAGELIRVKESCLAWENAIEKLLHNLGLTLLVPEEYYRHISEFINRTDLKGRIVYFRTSSRRSLPLSKDIHPDMLFQKLDIKESTFKPWLEQHLMTIYDYKCVSGIDELALEQKAVTQRGLVKSGDRNEKDDRPFRAERRNYILGWDNEEKIKSIKQELASLQLEIKEIQKNIAEAGDQVKNIQGKLSRIKLLESYEGYEKIDWMAISLRLEELTDAINTIRKNDKDLEPLRTQIEKSTKQLEEIEAEEKLHDKDLVLTEEKLKSNVGEIRENDEKIPVDLDMNEVKEGVQNFFSHNYTISSLIELKHIFDEYGKKLKAIIEVNGEKLREIENAIHKSMSNFVRPTADTLEKFPSWRGDIVDLKDEIEFIGDFLVIYENLDKKLPELKERFKKYMDESVIDKFTEFKTELTQRIEKIEDQIKELNKSLKRIDFKKYPATYIQLQYRDTVDIEVRGFKEKLKDWQPNYGLMQVGDEDKIREESFQKIRNILDELSGNDPYRKKVTDVKNWKNFSAKESNRENDAQVRFYPDSASLSGGEKAQFTYTILGAALAYQFGISEQGMKAKSFRFIAVDEAFSKLDLDNSKYLMDLCQQLHLQLLVITPLDKIQVAEPYIHSCQYVQNKNKRNSEVFNLTMEEYYTKKKEFELEAAAETINEE